MRYCYFGPGRSVKMSGSESNFLSCIKFEPEVLMLYIFICFCWYSWDESLVTDSYGGNYYDQGEDDVNVDDII